MDQRPGQPQGPGALVFLDANHPSSLSHQSPKNNPIKVLCGNRIKKANHSQM
jgi:hypothetical protein